MQESYQTTMALSRPREEEGEDNPQGRFGARSIVAAEMQLFQEMLLEYSIPEEIPPLWDEIHMRCTERISELKLEDLHFENFRSLAASGDTLAAARDLLITDLEAFRSYLQDPGSGGHLLLPDGSYRPAVEVRHVLYEDPDQEHKQLIVRGEIKPLDEDDPEAPLQRSLRLDDAGLLGIIGWNVLGIDSLKF